MLKWRFNGESPALYTIIGLRKARTVEVRGGEGTALYGPYLDMPAGYCTARILFAGLATGRVRIELASGYGRKIFAADELVLETLANRWIEVSASLDEPQEQFEVRLICDGEVIIDIVGLEIDLDRPPPLSVADVRRPVGTESRKSYAEKISSGFIEKYLSGINVLEVGYRGYVEGNVPIVPQAVGVDIGYPGYDGITLPFATESFNAIYSSHCFEHIDDYKAVLRDWYRLLKIGGFLIIVVPHQYLFERKISLPSFANPDHKRFYTPDSLLREIRESFSENSYRVRSLTEHDEGYDYNRLPRDHAEGRYEIELVVEKIRQPIWNLDDNTVRVYSAGEFQASERAVIPSPSQSISHKKMIFCFGDPISCCKAVVVVQTIILKRSVKSMLYWRQVFV